MKTEFIMYAPVDRKGYIIENCIQFQKGMVINRFFGGKEKFEVGKKYGWKIKKFLVTFDEI